MLGCRKFCSGYWTGSSHPLPLAATPTGRTAHHAGPSACSRTNYRRGTLGSCSLSSRDEDRKKKKAHGTTTLVRRLSRKVAQMARGLGGSRHLGRFQAFTFSLSVGYGTKCPENPRKAPQRDKQLRARPSNQLWPWREACVANLPKASRAMCRRGGCDFTHT